MQHCPPFLELKRRATLAAIHANFVESIPALHRPPQKFGIERNDIPNNQPAVTDVFNKCLNRVKICWNTWNVGKKRYDERTVSSLVVTLSSGIDEAENDIDNDIDNDSYVVLLEMGGQNVLSFNKFEWDLMSGHEPQTSEKKLDLMVFMDGLVLPAYHDVFICFGRGCYGEIKITSHPLNPEECFVPREFDIRILQSPNRKFCETTRLFDRVKTKHWCDFDWEPRGIFVVTKLKSGEVRPDLLIEMSLSIYYNGGREDTILFQTSSLDELLAFRTRDIYNSTGVDFPAGIRDCHFLPFWEKVNFFRSDFKMFLTLTHSEPVSVTLLAIHSNVLQTRSGMTGFQFAL
jgi:hypothetical protein